MKKILALLFVVAALTGCYKAKLNGSYEGGVDVTISIVEPDVADGVTLPDNYTATINGVEYPINDNNITLPEDMEIGDYTIYVYNEPKSIDIKNTTSESGGTIIATVAKVDDYIATDPEYLFFGKLSFTVEKGVEAAHSVILDQMIHDFAVEVDFGESTINSMSATISGVTQQWDCINNEYYGADGTILMEMSASTVVRSWSNAYIGEARLFNLNESPNNTLTMNVEKLDGGIVTLTENISEAMQEAFFGGFLLEKSIKANVDLLNEYVATESTTGGTGSSEKVDTVISIVDPTVADGVTLPDSYTATINGVEYPINDNKITLPENMKEGQYTLYLYNEPESVDIKNTTYNNFTIIATAANFGGYIDTDPDYLFFGKLDLLVQAIGMPIRLNITPEQKIYDFALSVDFGESIIKSVSATIDGMTQQWECVSDKSWSFGSLGTISMNMFMDETTAPTSNIYIGTAKLFGLKEESTNQLTMEVVDIDGWSYTVSTDISDAMAEAFATTVATAQRRVEIDIDLADYTFGDKEHTSGGDINDWDKDDVELEAE